MHSKRLTGKPRRSVKDEKKAPGKPQKTESLESQVARIGKQVEALIRRRGPVRLPDAQGEILEKLPQMTEGLSSQLDRIGKEVSKGKEPHRLADADRELLGEIQAEIQSLHKEVHAMKQMLEGMMSISEQTKAKISPSTEEQQKQGEESSAG